MGTAATLRITIDRALCTGFGACVDADPDGFSLGPDGMAQASGSSGRDRALKAAAACPMGAIRVTDEEGNDLV
jgi:ferredoxin